MKKYSDVSEGVGLVVLIAILVLFAIVMAGCQTVRGMAHDLGSTCNYIEDNVPAHDSRDPYKR